MTFVQIVLIVVGVLTVGLTTWIVTVITRSHPTPVQALAGQGNTVELLNAISSPMEQENDRLAAAAALIQAAARRQDRAQLRKAAELLMNFILARATFKIRKAGKLLLQANQLLNDPVFREAQAVRLAEADPSQWPLDKQEAIIDVLEDLAASDIGNGGSPLEMLVLGAKTTFNGDTHAQGLALKALLEAAQKSDPAIRKTAVFSLGQVASRSVNPDFQARAIGGLIACQEDPSKIIRLSATTALERVVLKTTHSEARLWAVETLVAALHGADPAVSAASVEALRHIRTVHPHLRSDLDATMTAGLRSASSTVRQSILAILRGSRLDLAKTTRQTIVLSGLEAAALDATPLVGRLAIEMLIAHEPQIRETDLRDRVLKILFNGLSHPDWRAQFLSGEHLISLYHSTALTKDQRAQILLRKDEINATGAASADTRTGWCTQCGNQVPLRRAHPFTQSIHKDPDVFHPADYRVTQTRYFCPECYQLSAEGWPEGALVDNENHIISGPPAGIRRWWQTK